MFLPNNGTLVLSLVMAVSGIIGNVSASEAKYVCGIESRKPPRSIFKKFGKEDMKRACSLRCHLKPGRKCWKLGGDGIVTAPVVIVQKDAVSTKYACGYKYRPYVPAPMVLHYHKNGYFQGGFKLPGVSDSKKACSVYSPNKFEGMEKGCSNCQEPISLRRGMQIVCVEFTCHGSSLIKSPVQYKPKADGVNRNLRG